MKSANNAKSAMRPARGFTSAKMAMVNSTSTPAVMTATGSKSCVAKKYGRSVGIPENALLAPPASTHSAANRTACGANRWTGRRVADALFEVVVEVVVELASVTRLLSAEAWPSM